MNSIIRNIVNTQTSVHVALYNFYTMLHTNTHRKLVLLFKSELTKQLAGAYEISKSDKLSYIHNKRVFSLSPSFSGLSPALPRPQQQSVSTRFSLLLLLCIVCWLRLTFRFIILERTILHIWWLSGWKWLVPVEMAIVLHIFGMGVCVCVLVRILWGSDEEHNCNHLIKLLLYYLLCGIVNSRFVLLLQHTSTQSYIIISCVCRVPCYCG